MYRVKCIVFFSMLGYQSEIISASRSEPPHTEDTLIQKDLMRFYARQNRRRRRYCSPHSSRKFLLTNKAIKCTLCFCFRAASKANTGTLGEKKTSMARGCELLK